MYGYYENDQAIGEASMKATAQSHQISIEIGSIPIRVNTEDPEFLNLLERRYAGFTGRQSTPAYELDVQLHSTVAPQNGSEPEVTVTCDENRWIMRRGDFYAEWDTQSRSGYVRQTANPYSIDCVLRILHTLHLSREGGFLLHSASAVRRGKTFLFSGVSGAGKTTISRLAPPDATLLTDEISYVRRQGDSYWGFGTPFSGELAEPGANVAAPVETLFFLEKGPENRRENVPAAEAVHTLLRNILFFSGNKELMQLVFQSACEFVQRVQVQRLIFKPDATVWEII
jgi:hypothetical protein